MGSLCTVALKTYTEALGHASQDCELAIVGCDPSHPAEVGENSENVVREPEIYKHARECDQEESVSCHAPHLLERAHDGAVFFVVEGSIERDGDQGSRPDTVRRVNQELSGKASKTISNEVGRKSVQEHVSKATSVLLVKVLRQHLYPDDVVGVGRAARGICHDSNQHMFLLIETSRVQVDSLFGERNLDFSFGHPLLPSFTQGEGEQLGDIGIKTNSWLTNFEELVDKSKEDGKEDTDSPGSNGGDRCVWIIVVINDSAHFSVRAVIGNKGGLELHLLHKSLMLLRIFHDGRIGCVLLVLPGGQYMADYGVQMNSLIFCRVWKGKFGSPL